MQENVPNSSTPSVSELVTGIVSDAQKLIRQEIDLARTEFDSQWKKLKVAVVASAMIAVMLSAAVVLLGQTLAHLISELTSASLWVGYASATGIFALTGLTLYLISKQDKFRDLDIIPRKTVESIKEDLTWIKKQA